MNLLQVSKFCSDLDCNLWQETEKETKKINEYASLKLKDIKFDLGGSAQIELIYFLTRYLKPKIVFNALHGKYGEDGFKQSILESLKIPYK